MTLLACLLCNSIRRREPPVGDTILLGQPMPEAAARGLTLGLGIQTLDPLWFFCAQTEAISHCEQGMVFSINAKENSTEKFAAFQLCAINAVDAALIPKNTTSASNVSTTSGTSTSASPTSISSTKASSLAARLIVGGVIGALGLLAALGFLVHWVCHRRRNLAFAGRLSTIEKSPLDNKYSMVPRPSAQQESPDHPEQAEAQRPAEKSARQSDGASTQLLDTASPSPVEELPQYTPQRAAHY
ncbi:hypothetical protein B0H14DRAFT_3862924 [Mycena olivaceomarginata]|nr:hypothetical protein B0H14DRAFT_3862924 [Mycena olivaceomarginata]